MVEYRVYEIGDDDHIVRSTPLICKDDHEATEKASELAEGHIIEVWSGERFVTRLGPGGQEKFARDLHRRARNEFA